MTTIRYGDRLLEVGEEQSVLDCLTTQGEPIPHACRSGVCQSCLMRAISGTPPAASQEGLSDVLQLQKHFLACICHPREDLTIALAGEAGAAISATVTQLEPLNADIMRVELEPHVPVDYRPGQFINLFRTTELGRSYSIASLPEDGGIHLHVRHLPGGLVSSWVHETLRIGQTVEIRGPLGNCFYVPGKPEQALLLIGTGSGLAPLYGILRDALRHSHTGPIRLFHGSRSADGLYLTGELRELARTHAQFDYVPCVSGPDVPSQHATGRVHDVALTDTPDLKGWRVFLCGHPDMVQQAQMRAYLAGASLADIHADAFQLSPRASK